jgi:hypothetical protein
LPDFEITEFRRPSLYLFAVHPVTRDSQDSGNVAQVPITTAFGELPELAEDQIFRCGESPLFQASERRVE